MNFNKKDYKEKYDRFLKEIEKIYKGRKLESSDYKEVYNLAKKYDLIIREKQIVHPNNISEIGVEQIYGTKSFCESWEEPYKVPKGNWLYEKENSCGTGCLCVDKGVDKSSLNKINSIKYANVGQICDGSKEHKPRTNLTPFIAFDYTSKKPLDLKNLKKLCIVAKEIVVNDYGKQNIRNLCTNKVKKYQKKESERSGLHLAETKKYPSILIHGKEYNTKKFWKESAEILSNIELNDKPRRHISSKIKPKYIKQSYGKASVKPEKFEQKKEMKLKKTSFMGLGAYL